MLLLLLLLMFPKHKYNYCRSCYDYRCCCCENNSKFQMVDWFVVNEVITRHGAAGLMVEVMVTFGKHSKLSQTP